VFLVSVLVKSASPFSCLLLQKETLDVNFLNRP